MIEIIAPIGVFILMGALAGGILTLASKVFFVKTDDKVEKILSCLPGINCGACGFSGCEVYAAAVANKKTQPNLCKPGGVKAAEAIGDVLGIKVEAGAREIAYVRCIGSNDVTGDKFTYNGTKSCVAQERYYGGKNECRFGCAGLGDCANVCDYDAISIVNGVAVVNSNRCTACGLCVKACPNKLIVLRKENEIVNVSCSSHDAGKATKAVCKSGCIACKICEKKCPTGAITVKDNLSVIDYAKCTSCGICAEVCPVKCIIITSSGC